MRHGCTMLNQSVIVLTGYRLPKCAVRPSFDKRQRTFKKVLHVIFYYKGPVMQLHVLQGRTVTEAFYKNAALKKLKVHFKRRRP